MRSDARELQRVLVAVDFSTESRQACRAARGLVSVTGGSLTVAHVRPFSDLRAAVFEDRGDLLKKKTPGLRKAMAHHYEQLLSDMIQEGDERSVLLRGKPALELCHEAGQNHDLLVMGSRGRGGVASMLLGSTVQEVLTLSKVPVMVIPVRATRGGSRRKAGSKRRRYSA